METSKETKMKQEMKSNLSRALSIGTFREMDGEERTIELSFSSEEPYNRWWGTEILDHAEGAVDLDRLNSIGCVLFNHDRDKVIAKIIKAWVQNNRGKARIQFDKDEQSDIIYQKVKNGTLKGISVGYSVSAWEEVPMGKTSADGRFAGPSNIAKRWAPHEISVVSIPADVTVGIGREIEFRTNGMDMDYFERQIQLNINLLGGKINAERT